MAWLWPPSLKAPGPLFRLPHLHPGPPPAPRAHLPGASYMLSELAAQASEPAPVQAELHFHPGKARHRVECINLPGSRSHAMDSCVALQGGLPSPHVIDKWGPGRGHWLSKPHSYRVVGLGPETHASGFLSLWGGERNGFWSSSYYLFISTTQQVTVPLWKAGMCPGPRCPLPRLLPRGSAPRQSDVFPYRSFLGIYRRASGPITDV